MQNANEAQRQDALAITRVFDAPPDLVFAAWTEPAHLAQWSGPVGFTTPHHSTDLRVGGRYRACLRSPEGEDHWVGGVYREIAAPTRLVMTHAWEDEGGQPGPETLVTIVFHAQGGGKTRMEFRQTGFTSDASREGHEGGWSSSFDRLHAHLEEATA